MRRLLCALAMAVSLGGLLTVYFISGAPSSDGPEIAVVKDSAPPTLVARRVPAVSSRAALAVEDPSSRSEPRELAEEWAELTPLPEGNGILTIQVVDRARQARAGARVTLMAGRSRGNGLTDDGGAVVFPDLAPGSYWYRIEGDDFPPLSSAGAVSLVAREEKTLSVTVGSFELEISGRVADAQGRPVAGIEVLATKQLFEPRASEYRHDSLWSRTSSDGAFIFEGLEEADYLLQTQATDDYPTVRRTFRAGTRSAELIVNAARVVEVHGRVTSPRGEPVEGTTLTPLGQPSRKARTDSQGRYSLLLALAEEKAAYAFVARHEGSKGVQVNVPKTDLEQAEPVDIVLEPLSATAAVSGLILDPERRPLAGEQLTLFSTALRASYRASTDAQGEFFLRDVQVGEYRVSVFPRRRAFRDFSTDSVTVPPRGLDIEVVLEPLETGKLAGALVDPAGDPIPHFVLWLRSTQASLYSLKIESDERGRFEVEGVPAGELRFETRSLPRLSVRDLEFEAGNGDADTVPEATLVLDWGNHTCSGSVVDPLGNPVPGARVTMTWTSEGLDVFSSSLREVETDSRGDFSFDGLAAVRHKLRASAEGYVSACASHPVGGTGPEPVLHLSRASRR